MSQLVEIVRQARSSGDYQALAAMVPYARFLGIGVTAHGGELVGKMTFKDSLIGNPTVPALHGGTIAALLESTAVFRLLVEMETVQLPKIINITVAYLRSGRPVDTFAKGIITKHGRRVASVEVSAWQDNPDEPIATAVAHFLVQPNEEQEG
jgi:acyl-coenzyme A thioesterase PaaI-like protein